MPIPNKGLPARPFNLNTIQNATATLKIGFLTDSGDLKYRERSQSANTFLIMKMEVLKTNYPNVFTELANWTPEKNIADLISTFSFFYKPAYTKYETMKRKIEEIVTEAQGVKK